MLIICLCTEIILPLKFKYFSIHVKLLRNEHIFLEYIFSILNFHMHKSIDKGIFIAAKIRADRVEIC
jgi:hypothetical protein